MLPMANLKWKSPFEVLYGKQPVLDDLRVIGCLCFAHIVGQSNKFAPRATKCVLLGYTFGLKGYKLYDLEHKKIFHSKDVVFQETIFPYKQAPVPLATSLSTPSYEHLFSTPLGPSVSDCPSPLPQPHLEVVSDTFSTNTSPQPLGSPIPQPSSDHSYISETPTSAQLPLLPTTPVTSSSTTDPHAPPLRKSTRVADPPNWLKDFVCKPSLHKHTTAQAPDPSSSSSVSFTTHLQPTSPYPLFTSSDFAHCSADYVMSLVSVLHTPEPSTYAQAQQYPEWVKGHGARAPCIRD